MCVSITTSVPSSAKELYLHLFRFLCGQLQSENIKSAYYYEVPQIQLVQAYYASVQLSLNLTALKRRLSSEDDLALKENETEER